MESFEPRFESLVFEEIPAPDYSDAIVVPVRGVAASIDPTAWAGLVFSPATAPGWVRLLFGARQTLVGLLGISKAPADTFKVSKVVGDEALICADAGHLDFRCGVAFDKQRQLLRVTTAVRLRGWRGRVYFAPVSILHGPVTRSMMLSAARRAGELSAAADQIVTPETAAKISTGSRFA